MSMQMTVFIDNTEYVYELSVTVMFGRSLFNYISPATITDQEMYVEFSEIYIFVIRQLIL